MGIARVRHRRLAYPPPADLVTDCNPPRQQLAVVGRFGSLPLRRGRGAPTPMTGARSGRSSPGSGTLLSLPKSKALSSKRRGNAHGHG